MKRTLTGIFAATMVLGTIVPTAFAKAQASDVDSSNQYYAAINALESSNILNLYADGTFKPDQRLARAQFAAYVYNVVNAAGKITKHYTQPDQPYKDEDKYFRNQLNDMYLYGYLNNLDLGNGDFGLYWMTPAWWAAQLLCNVAGISYDSSSRYDAMNKARDQGWFANTPDEDANPNYYLNRDEMAQILENFVLDQFPDLLAGQAQSLTLSAKDATIAAGTTDALTLAGKDVSGADLTIDPSKVTYSVDNSSTGFVNGSGVFTATAPGKYTITANYGGVSATTTVTVYGQPASLGVSAAGDLVADHASGASSFSTQKVTVNVYDAQGNVVQNYNGPVTLASGTTSDATVETATVNAVNGVATFTIDSATAAKAGDKVTLTATTPNPSLTATGTVAIDAPQAASFSVGYNTGAPQGLAVNNSGSSTTLKISTLDQAGVAFAGANQYVTASISGAATFAGGATSQQVWVGGGSGTVVVAGKQGQTGNAVVTVSASGIQGATFSVPAYIQTPTSSISASVGGSVAEGSNTTLSVKALDTNGNLALTEAGNVTVKGLPTGATITGAGVVANADGSYTVPLSQGLASVTLNNNSYVGSATLTLSYTVGSTPVTTTVPVTFAQGSASKIALTNLSNGQFVPANTTQNFTFQLQDAAGTAQKVAGVTFSVYTDVPNYTAAQTVTTDANGQFSLSMTLPSYVASSTNYHIYVQPGTGVTGFPASTTYTFGVNNGWQLNQAVTGNVYGTDAASNAVSFQSLLNGETLNAGQAVYLDVYGVDGTNAAHGGDTYTVTSSNPSVVSVNGLDANGNTTGATDLASASVHNLGLKAGLAGTSVITITDTSVASKPSVSFTVRVNPLGVVQKVSVTGLNATASAPVTVVPGQSYPIQITLTDNGGNAAYGSGTVTVNLTDGTGLTNFRNAAGASIASVNIDKNVGSTTVYWVAPSLSSGTQLTLNATDASGALTAGTLGTLQIQ